MSKNIIFGLLRYKLENAEAGIDKQKRDTLRPVKFALYKRRKGEYQHYAEHNRNIYAKRNGNSRKFAFGRDFKGRNGYGKPGYEHKVKEIRAHDISEG